MEDVSPIINEKNIAKGIEQFEALGPNGVLFSIVALVMVMGSSLLFLELYYRIQKKNRNGNGNGNHSKVLEERIEGIKDRVVRMENVQSQIFDKINTIVIQITELTACVKDKKG